jgi:O-antigen ligase
MEIPEVTKTHIKHGKGWAMLFLFFPVAWWMSRNPRRIAVALGLMIAGFTLGILSAIDTAVFDQIRQGTRSGFHFNKAIIFGFHCAVALLCIGLFAPHWLNSNNSAPSRVKKIILLSVTGLSILVFFQGLVMSQSRGVWLAVLVTLPSIFFFHYFFRRRNEHTARFPRYVLPLAISIALIILSLNWNTIQKRLSAENQELRSVVTEGLDVATLSSSTYRLHMWRFGLHKWSERPLVGWGPGSTQHLVAQQEDVALRHTSGVPWDHLHSAYIEILVQLGLTGGVLMLLICILMIRGLILAFREGFIPMDWLLFLLGNFVLIAVYSLTDFRHLQWNWRFYWLLISGIAFAYLVIRNESKEVAHETL